MPDLRIDCDAVRAMGETSSDVGLRFGEAALRVESSLIRLADDIGNLTVAEEVAGLLDAVRNVHPQVVTALVTVGTELQKAAAAVEAADAKLGSDTSNGGGHR